MVILKKLMAFMVIFIVAMFINTTTTRTEMPLRVVVNGEKIIFPDAQPFIDENGRTQVPVRFVSEALAALVDWNENKKAVTVDLNKRNVALTIDNNIYQINSINYQMDTAPILKESRTFVPIRFVSEALGASVYWDEPTKSIYIKIDPNTTPVPLPTPLPGKITYYDGIEFNDVIDIDENGRIKMEKATEFAWKLTDKLSFITEDGKFYIKCDYPTIPEGYEWSLTIRINTKSSGTIGYTPLTNMPNCRIPTEGSFKQETTYITDINDVESFVIYIKVINEHRGHTGLLEIVYRLDGSKKRVEFLPEDSQYEQKSYTDIFDFNRMFQWK